MNMTSMTTILARTIATVGGVGYAPVAPGTFGTAAAVPLAWVCAPLTWWAYALVCVAVTLVGIWAAAVADRSWGTHDSGRIVVDEVAGYLVTMALVDRSDPVLLLLGFLLFRAFDIAKPFPVRQIDRQLGGGSGVVLDDVVAGVMAGLVLAGMALTDLHGHLRALVGG